MSSLEKEDCLIQIRDKLRRDAIKLWLSPYYLQETGTSMPDIQVSTNSFKMQAKNRLGDC